MEYKIDATEKILGRLASDTAMLLRGKDRADFDPSRLSGNKVNVYNVDKMKVTGKKMDQKVYRRHTGFHGGLKEETLSRRMARDSRAALREAVLGMLPKNRLRSKMIRNLVLYKEEM